MRLDPNLIPPNVPFLVRDEDDGDYSMAILNGDGTWTRTPVQDLSPRFHQLALRLIAEYEAREFQN